MKAKLNNQYSSLLLLEDNQVLIEIIRGVFSRQVDRLCVTTESEKAIDLLGSSNFDMVISDINLENNQTALPFLKEVFIYKRPKYVMVFSSDAESLDFMRRLFPNPNWQFQDKNEANWLLTMKSFIEESIIQLTQKTN